MIKHRNLLKSCVHTEYNTYILNLLAWKLRCSRSTQIDLMRGTLHGGRHRPQRTRAPASLAYASTGQLSAGLDYSHQKLSDEDPRSATQTRVAGPDLTMSIRSLQDLSTEALIGCERAAVCRTVRGWKAASSSGVAQLSRYCSALGDLDRTTAVHFARCSACLNLGPCHP